MLCTYVPNCDSQENTFTRFTVVKASNKSNASKNTLTLLELICVCIL